MTGVSIIIPVYNALEEAMACIESLYSTPSLSAFEVIVVDNGSAPDVADWLAREQQRRLNFHFLRFNEPLGFARANNEGARLARYDYLVLLNSDTIVGEGWLDRLAQALTDDPLLGIVSPVTNRCGHPRQRDPAARSLEASETRRYAQSIAGRGGLWFEAQRLVFFCVMLRRTLWEQLAGLDEAFCTGNFEDDDFCLRTRIAGYRMAILPDAFVFHHERRSFESNRLNHGEWIAKNQKLFAERASRWSRTLRPASSERVSLPLLSVIVPVLPHRIDGLRGSLASLANQTVQGFETVVVSPANLDVSSTVSAFANRLRVRTVQAAAEDDQGPAHLLNTGLSQASGTEIACLPAADIFYPFHLEVLAEGLAVEAAAAMFTAWSVVAGSPENERRASVQFPDAEPNIELGDWAPLLCWMHRASAVPGLAFDPLSGNFAPWRFLLQLRQQTNPRYLCRVTCERRPDPPHATDAASVDGIMRHFPVNNPWKETQRRQFQEGVRQGNWEDRLVISRNGLARRARALLGARALALATKRFEEAAAALGPVHPHTGKPDIILFSSVEWTALTQRPHHFATGLAARGHRVFWIDVQFRAPELTTDNLVSHSAPNLFHIELPAFGSTLYRVEWRPEAVDTVLAAFTYLRAAYGIHVARQLVHFPLWEPLCRLLATRFKWQIVYDCLDDQSAFSGLFGHHLGETESKLIADSSAVIVSGQTLLDMHRERRPDTVMIPNAVDFHLFHGAQSRGLLTGLAHPIAGFFGAFSDWLDFDWVDAAARRFPHWSFVYIGREGFAHSGAGQRWKEVIRHPNVHVFPQATQSKLSHYLAEFDVCIMPFRDLPITRSMNAVKLYEYLAAGKPVIAPDLPETRPLRDAGLIATYQSFEESFALLTEAASEADPSAMQARVAFARENTWSHRLDALSQVLDTIDAPPPSSSPVPRAAATNPGSAA